MSMASRTKGKPPSKTCAECGAAVNQLPFHTGKDGVPRLVICEYCAAFSIWDGTKFRALRTQEWMDLALDPRWYDLLIERNRILELCTAPPKGLPTHGPS